MMLPHFTPYASVSDPHEFVSMIWPVNKDLSEGKDTYDKNCPLRLDLSAV